MKLLITSLIFVLSGCDNLMHGRQGPVVVKDANQQIMYTTCNAAAENWGTCYSKALKACPNDYIVLEKNDDPKRIFRNMTFQCKK
jgi:protein involved in sex pheromone biosynthesis